MRLHAATLSMSLLIGGSALAADVTLSGNWRFTADVAGTLKERTCSLRQRGPTFTGICKDDDGTLQVNGTIDSNIVTFKYDFSGFGQTIPVVCKGRLDGARLAGSLTLGPLTGTCALTNAAAMRVSAAEDRKCRSHLGRTFEGATVTKAEVAPASDSAPEICVVRGEMPQDLDFEVRMPARWNGRTVFIGGGGFDGGIGNRFISASAMESGQFEYATIATNHGHNANVTPDASFALDVQMLSEYAYLAVPRVLAPAKAILHAQYGRAFDRGKLVYEGCSGGGRQALIQVQRYPELFDGVVSRAPASSFVPQFLWYAKVIKLQAAPGGALSASKVDAIGSAVRARCDRLDGLEDGIIGRPDACQFDPVELACTANETADCLTPAQVATARGFYEPTSVGNGRFTWPGFMPGGEKPGTWLSWQNQGFIGFMRYMIARDPNVDPLTVDPEEHLSRLEYLSGLIDAADPDLRRFQARGGKLILWTGQADWLITANNATDYYQRVVDTMGGQAVADEFVEYYVSPDVDHCSGGAGADRIDLVTPMFDWLEKGIRPSSRTLVATKSLAGATPLSRPLCQFPRYPRYVGGDSSRAASFVCAIPDDVSK